MGEVQLDLSDADPEEISRLVGTISDDDLEGLMQSELRGEVLDEVFGRMGEHFRADKAGDLEAVLHWKVFDRPGGGYDHVEIIVAGGTCTISERPEREPDVTLKTKPVDFLRLVTGQAGPKKLALRGRLRVQGDLGLAVRLSGLFHIPG